MQFTITQAGLLAANAVSAGGPKITISTFSVGSAYGYPPNSSDTALHGTVLHTQNVNNFAVISANEVAYELTLNDTVGDFSFGEVGMYLQDGTLFALGTLDALQLKTATTPGNAGNIVSFDAHLALSQISALVNFPIMAMPNARMLEVPTVDQLMPPVISDSNAYLTLSTDTGGSAIPAFRGGDFQWSFPSFTKIFTGTVGSNGAGYTSATVTLVGGSPTVAATAKATVSGGSVTGLTLTDGGSGYASTPTVAITGDGTGATATATLVQGVTSISVVNPGAGYATAPTVSITGGGGSGATATATVTAGKVTAITVTNKGSGYTSPPTVTLTGSGTGATAAAVVTGTVSALTITANTYNSLICSAASGSIDTVTSGKYIIQFDTGVLAGYCRMLTGASGARLGWVSTSPTGTPPAAGTTFSLWQSNHSIMNMLWANIQPQTGALRPVRLVSEGLLTLSGGATVDGLAVADGDRVLVVGQTNPADNGIYVVSTTGAWTRAADASSPLAVKAGQLVPVSEGSTWADSVWQLSADGAIVIGTTPLTYQPANYSWTVKTANDLAVLNAVALS